MNTAARKKSRTLAALLTLIGVIVLGLIDYYTGPEISFSILYVIPVSYAAWFLGKGLGLLMALLCGLVWLVSDLGWIHYGAHPAIPYWNASMRLGIFLIIAVLVSKLQSLNQRLHEKLQEGAVSLLKETEERRRAEEEQVKLSSVVEHTADTVTITDRNGVIQYVNPAFEQLTGYSKDEAVGNTSRILQSGQHDPQFYQNLWSTILGGQTFRTEFINRKKSGEIYYQDETITPFKDAQNNITHFISTGRDVTQRRRAEQEFHKLNQELESRVTERTLELKARVAEVEKLNRAMVNILEDLQAARRSAETFARRTEEANLHLNYANKELETFSYSVSHDLRAPLRAIGNFAELLLTDCATQLSPDCQEYVHRVHGSYLRMGSLIDDLMKLSLVSQSEIRVQEVDLTALARSIGAELQSRQPVPIVDFVVEEDLRIHADDGLLRIVIENLLGNAWKFTSKQARARIEVRSASLPDRQTAYYVRDNGAGFDMAGAGKLFQAFQRLHRKKDFEGTGIGLAIVQRIIQRHSGRIWAESKPNEGATFFFTLPCTSSVN